MTTEFRHLLFLKYYLGLASHGTSPRFGTEANY